MFNTNSSLAFKQMCLTIYDTMVMCTLLAQRNAFIMLNLDEPFQSHFCTIPSGIKYDTRMPVHMWSHIHAKSAY